MDLFCAKCNKPLIFAQYSDSDGFNYKCIYHALIQLNSKKEIEYYNFDQLYNNVLYNVDGRALYNQTSINNNLITVPLITFSNQQEMISILPRLLYLKAFG